MGAWFTRVRVFSGNKAHTIKRSPSCKALTANVPLSSCPAIFSQHQLQSYVRTRDAAIITGHLEKETVHESIMIFRGSMNDNVDQ
jgi:hypothetical protein